MKELLKQIKEKYPKSYIAVTNEITVYHTDRTEIKYSFYLIKDTNNSFERENARHTYFTNSKDLIKYMGEILNDTKLEIDTIEQAEKLMEEIEK